jgi:hypothetical protein
MKKLIIFLFIIISVQFKAQTNYELINNISYNEFKGDEYITEKCKLDIYYPKDVKAFKTVVWFHGGGLTGGEKEIPERLKNNGFAIVGVGYRLSPKVKAEVCIDDAALAVSWVYKNISKYGGNSNKIYLSGYSAGGYLALMLGLDYKRLSKYGIDCNKLAGIISFSGQCITHFTIRKERGINELTPIIDELAPLFYVRKNTAPIILLTGDREKELFGRYEENAYLLRMLKLNGNSNCIHYEFDGYGHNMLEPGYPILIEKIKED